MKKTWWIGLAVILVVGTLGYLFIWPQFQIVVVDEVVPEASAVVVPPASLIDTPVHPATGAVTVLENGSQTFLRYENFKTINGPDLFVYLSTDLEATDFVSLGALKATEGNVNYDIPAGTDIVKYHYALVWCERFGVLFNYADVRPQ